MVAFRQPPNLKSMLCRAKLPVGRQTRGSRTIVGMKKCRQCPMCIHVDNKKEFRSTNTRTTYKLKGEFNCKTVGVVYLITCKKCNLQYVGQTGRSLHHRMREHMYSIVKNEKTIGMHFNGKRHNHEHMNVTVIEKVIPNTPHYRLEREELWIKTLNTKSPRGLNIND